MYTLTDDLLMVVKEMQRRRESSKAGSQVLAVFILVLQVKVVKEAPPQLAQEVLLTRTPRGGRIQQTMQTPKPSDT